MSSKFDDRSIHDLDTVSAAWVAQWLEAWRSTVTVGQSTSRYETRPAAYFTRTEVRNGSGQPVQLGGAYRAGHAEGREDRLKNTSVPADRDVRKPWGWAMTGRVRM